MATTTLASSAADRQAQRAPGTGGVDIWGPPQPLRADLFALLALLGAVLLGLAIGYAAPNTLQLGVDGRYTLPYLRGFHEPEGAAGAAAPTYRWTRERSTVLAPGLGRGLWQTDLTLSSPFPAEQPKQALISTDNRTWPLQLAATPRIYHLLTPSTGDLSVSIAAETSQVGADPRPLGVVFGGAAFAPVATTLVPPLALLAYTLIALALAYATLRLCGLAAWLALLGPLSALALLAWALATNRPAIGLLMPRLAILSLFGFLATLALRWLWRGLVRLGRLDPAPWLLPGLLAIFVVGFWLKAPGLLYPYSATKDIPWHVRDIQSVLSGDVRQFYLPSSFSYGKMPVSEWGNNPPLLPYSPFFHIVAASFALFPWPLDMSVNVFSVIFDANRAILIGALALALGQRSRVALLAALLYAVTPFTFMLHSWGNVPTTLGIWWTLWATTVLALTYGRWHERRIFALVTLSLLGAFLFYFVMAVFTGFFVILLAVALALFGRGLPRQVKPLLLSSALALALSILIYYGLFIPEMIERTLPYILNTVAAGQTNTGQAEHIALGTYLANHYTHMGYISYPVRHGVWLPTLLALPGLWLVRKQRFALLALGTWLVVAFLFFVVGLRVSMVDKYIFYAMPALALLSAVVFDRVWRRARVVPLVVAAVYLLTFISALDIWILRLQRVY